MTTISVDEAKQNLERIIEQVMNDAEPAVVRTERGDEVVLLSRDEFDSWNETVYLLSTPANAAHLKKSIEEAERGQTQENELIEA
ncbi:MAG TPA: type II toxin-antitoxin system prevent-host-death family antitoxin [Pyrinomonadaceae bacterium]|jgi:antitoxin YefM|nr:type II toxin-antitoxin system prevent-host-death family antitoxin [Pyrinomonadaceae bacterium]